MADLANPDVIVVTCAPEVPCGKYATTRCSATPGVTVTPESLEENVKAVVTKVTLGEADAGIVYSTDVTAAGADADGVDIPADINVLAEYPDRRDQGGSQRRRRAGVRRLRLRATPVRRSSPRTASSRRELVASGAGQARSRCLSRCLFSP